MTEFTPVAGLVGGALICAAAVMLLALNGRIAGISGIVRGVIAPAEAGDVAWRICLVVGLAVAPIVVGLAGGEVTVPDLPGGVLWMVVAGLVVGVGTTLGGGCTSGHGVCGMARLSVRSIAATMTFMATGIVTVFVIRHLLGWG